MASSQSTSLDGIQGKIDLQLKVVDLTGEDVREWLQGQVTQDLRTLAFGGSTRACLCKPTGQLLAHLEVWDLGDRLRLLIHDQELAAFLARVDEAVIMEDVEATVVLAMVSHTFGPLQTEPSGGLLPATDYHREHIRWRSRTGLPGFDRIVPEDGEPTDLPELATLLDGTGHGFQSDPELFAALTLANGEPTPGIDTNEKTLPPELGPAFEAATISYRKGCYTGQEILMRLHSRGHTNRTWTGLLSPVLLTGGDKVFAEGAEVGRVTRAGVHPTLGPIAGAFLRREADGKALAVETANGSVAVEARDLPLSIE